MRDLEKYRGVIPAFYACYDEDGEISAERTEALALHFLEKGVKGLYVNGSSGECVIAHWSRGPAPKMSGAETRHRSLGTEMLVEEHC